MPGPGRPAGPTRRPTAAGWPSPTRSWTGQS